MDAMTEAMSRAAQAPQNEPPAPEVAPPPPLADGGASVAPARPWKHAVRVVGEHAVDVPGGVKIARDGDIAVDELDGELNFYPISAYLERFGSLDGVE